MFVLCPSHLIVLIQGLIVRFQRRLAPSASEASGSLGVCRAVLTPLLGDFGEARPVPVSEMRP